MLVISLFCDTAPTIFRACNDVYNEKFRHISIKYDYVRELISNEIIIITFIKLASKNNAVRCFLRFPLHTWSVFNGNPTTRIP